MDISELIPLLILALLYFFGRKKNEEEKRKKATKGSQTQAGDSSQKGLSLQQRLDQALQQMEQRIAAESASSQRAEPSAKENEIHLGPRDREGVDPDEYANEIRRMTASTLYDTDQAGLRLDETGDDSSLLDGGVVKSPGHSGFSVRLDEGRPAWREGERISEEGNQYDFNSLLTEIPNETYHGHGFTGFSEAHGLHWGEIDDLDEEVPVVIEEVRRDFGSIPDLRRAVIMAEILDRPVSQRRGNFK